MDKENDLYKQCSPYAPFLAWATQYCVLVSHSKNEQKVKKSIASIEKDMEAKEHKKKHI